MKSTSGSELNTEMIGDTARSRSGSISKSVSYSNLDAEKVLEGFGTFGTYQVLIYTILNTGFFLCACETRIFALIMGKTEFTCNRPEGFNVTLDQCEYFDYEINSTTKCSNFSYIEEKNTYLTSEFDLVCDNDYYVEYSMSLYMLGTMLFTPILTQVADLYGRRITYLVVLWLTVLANIGCALVSSHTIFMGFIFVAGIGATGVEVVGFILMLEIVAPSFRSYTPLISIISWVVGYMTVGVIHMYIELWRWQLFALTAPFILSISYYWLVPESIHWLITHNKTAEVEKWIKTAEKFSNKKINLEKCKCSDPLIPYEGGSEQDHHKRTFIDLFSNGPILFQLICQSFVMIVVHFTYWALSIFSTDLHENKMIGYFLSNLMELPAAGTVLLFTYFGRRTVTSVSLLIQAVVMCVAVFYPGKNLTSLILFLLVRALNSVVWVSEPLLIGEMAPTSTRNIFYGLILFIGKTGSIIAPYFNRLKSIHEAAPAIAMALFSLIAGMLALCSPETANAPMPEDIDDFNPGPVYSWIFGKHRKKNKAIDTVQKSSVSLLGNDLEDKAES